MKYFYTVLLLICFLNVHCQTNLTIKVVPNDGQCLYVESCIHKLNNGRDTTIQTINGICAFEQIRENDQFFAVPLDIYSASYRQSELKFPRDIRANGNKLVVISTTNLGIEWQNNEWQKSFNDTISINRSKINIRH